MSVITQEYDIDLEATGEYPVVKMSQFDTGSRTIVFTVYDGRELAQIDGMVARVDGTRSDGVEFSSTCTVGTGSKVSFTITQEMTKHAGKHAAELVLFDASGNPIGTQNFIIEVEAAPMVRDSAASADDRTLYDQYTQSLEEKFDAFKAGVNDTIYSINELIGASSKPVTIYDANVQLGVNYIHVRLTYDPLTALVHAYANGSMTINTGDNTEYDLYQIDGKYCPPEEHFTDVIGDDTAYFISTDNLKELISGDTAKNSNYLLYYIYENNGAYKIAFSLGAGLPDHDGYYSISLNATWYARGGKFIGATPVPGKRYSFGNGLTVNANGVVSVKAGKNLGFSSDGTLNAAGGSGSGNAGLITAGTATANGVAVEYYTVHKDA